jgi:pyruvate dehydrogenase E1 component alpha subunit
MPGTSVEDGQDVFEVYQTMSEAVERAREQNRPTLIDVKTYRYSGHSMSDPATYRSKDEVERERQRDPVDRLGHWLIDEDICSREDLESIDEECKERVSEAKDFAEDADFPDSSALTEDVYVDYPGDIH